MPAQLFAELQDAQAASNGLLRSLDSHQNATVTALAELIIPETDTPGAKAAKVNEFIDLLLSDWFNQSEKKHFLEGLALIDEQSRKRSNADFVSCKPAEQTDLMKQFDAAAMEFTRTHKTRQINLTPDIGDFFYNFKRLALVGYFTSEIGFKQALHASIIPPGHAGCAPVKESR